MNRANQEIHALMEEDLDSAIDHLSRRQPAYRSFLLGHCLGDQELLEMATMASLFVFKAYEAEYPGKTAILKSEDLVSVSGEASVWFAELQRPEAIDDPPAESEPLLFGYIIENLNASLATPRKDGTPHTGYDQRLILIAIKMLVLALERAATRSRTEVRPVISADSVNKASKLIDGPTEEQLDRALALFFQAQPLVLEFIVRLSGLMDRIHDMVMQLSFFVFKVYEMEHPGKMSALKREDFLPGYDQARAWTADYINGATHASIVAEDPFLLKYFYDKLGRPLEDGTYYSTQEEHDILLIIKMVMLALDRAVER